ncbi:MAG: hypothetical protein KKB81_05110 [Candidatus Margulisbacteria bacterium]|nr:hypothetical protein [Candidatus Margulisiibacteriota bacterium]MBU1021362.1 hypothetical protein [Candidatus Margulisiibacteriota bacterium]MBU1729149.1 hypothetical protein [Candidatus Margulisiibacteriota bacterium]MBU1954822.1 hypothetical protein [Candidatus Margulisiibacteriota bacterium]
MAQEERHTQIMLEDIKHKLKIIAEGHEMLAQKIDIISDKVESLDNRMDFAGLPKQSLKSI